MSIKKLSYKEYEQFFNDFHWRRINNLRVGQAFLNTFFPNIADDRLYYEEDPNEALKQIIERYVEE